MKFLVAIEPGDDMHAFGVVVPELPGCFSAGDTLVEALANAREAISLHLELGAGDAPPLRAVQDWMVDPAYDGWVWALVSAEVA